jgi:hypothetical protein
MKLPRTRNRWTERVLIDDAFDAYLDWRDESAEVWHAYKRWNGAPAREARIPCPASAAGRVRMPTLCPSKTTASRLLSIRSKGAHHE